MQLVHDIQSSIPISFKIQGLGDSIFVMGALKKARYNKQALLELFLKRQWRKVISERAF